MNNEKLAKEIIEGLDERARSYDSREYGLPIYNDEQASKMLAFVLSKLEEAETQPTQANEGWKVVGHSYQIADTGDYDGCYEITNGSVSFYSKLDDEETLQLIADALNAANANIYLDDAAEFEASLYKQFYENANKQNTTLTAENERLREEVVKIKRDREITIRHSDRWIGNWKAVTRKLSVENASLTAENERLREGIREINYACGTVNFSSHNQMKEAIESAIGVSETLLTKE